jgi:hypothetical protein
LLVEPETLCHHIVRLSCPLLLLELLLLLKLELLLLLELELLLLLLELLLR